MTRQIILCHISGSPTRLLSLTNGKESEYHWIFLCQDYSKFLEWRAALTKLTSVPISRQLSTVAHRLRKPYLDLIADLGEQYRSASWWASSISEKNTLIRYLFLYCCYLQVAIERMSETDGPLCIVCESWSLLETLAEWSKKQSIVVRYANKALFGKKRLINISRGTAYIMRFLLNGIRGRFSGKRVAAVDPTREIIVIHTFVDEACFGIGGEFHDRYFPGLCGWLENLNYTVLTLPVLFNIERSCSDAWKWLSASRQRFINPYRYYRIRDYLAAIRLAWESNRLPRGRMHLEGLDVTRLFHEERKFRAFSNIEWLLYLFLPQRLAGRGMNISKLITEYENLIPEKMLRIGFRNTYPLIKIIGYQHGALYPLLLSTFVTSKEAGFAPLPDKVVCNGPFFKDILTADGLPEEKAVVGPALRYDHLHHLDTAKSPQDQNGRILVPLPLALKDGVELIIKLLQAFQNSTELTFFLKPHPMSSPEQILHAAKLEKLPGHFQFVSGFMSEWLPRVHMMISLSSCTIYEGFAAGLPVVVVGRESSLELNPLGFSPSFNKLFYSPGDIYKETKRLLSLDREELIDYRRKVALILQESFSPVTDELLSEFT